MCHRGSPSWLVVARCLVNRSELAFVFQLRELVLAPLVMRQLALQLAKRLEPLRLEPALVGRPPHGASRLLLVPAVAEVAVGGQRVDVAERILEPALPELHLAHARRVDEQPPAGQPQELAVGRRVTAPLILVAHRGGSQLIIDRAAG